MNYQFKLDEIIKSIEGTPRFLKLLFYTIILTYILMKNIIED